MHTNKVHFIYHIYSTNQYKSNDLFPCDNVKRNDLQAQYVPGRKRQTSELYDDTYAAVTPTLFFKELSTAPLAADDVIILLSV